jgi:hypothetical protein
MERNHIFLSVVNLNRPTVSSIFSSCQQPAEEMARIQNWWQRIEENSKEKVDEW